MHKGSRPLARAPRRARSSPLVVEDGQASAECAGVVPGQSGARHAGIIARQITEVTVVRQDRRARSSPTVSVVDAGPERHVGRRRAATCRVHSVPGARSGPTAWPGRPAPRQVAGIADRKHACCGGDDELRKISSHAYEAFIRFHASHDGRFHASHDGTVWNAVW
jgi:hypothetical protein